MPLDPQATAQLRLQETLGLPPIQQQTPVQVRQAAEEAASTMTGPAADVRVEDSRMAGVAVRIFEPHGTSGLPVLIWFHGGGWVLGSVRTHDRPCRALAHRAHCRVVSVDYRLAPEHRFPAAVEDAWAVTEAVLAEGRPVAVGGDSSGGNLAAVVALRARDRDLPLRLQILIYPVTDCDFSRPSYLAYATGYGLTREGMRWFWSHYLGGQPWDHPEAAPLRAPSLSGAAPALVMVCEFDPLHDEGLAYAERLRAAGVQVEVVEQEGMIHGFFRFRSGGEIDRTFLAYDQCAAALRKALV